MSDRCGIACGGNWIVDIVKHVDHLPARGMLGSITAQERTTGGAAANVLLDLSRMQVGLPLTAVGVIGRDDDGRFILDRAREYGIDVTHLGETDEAGTSYTDVMNEAGTGERQFFHYRGVNALFGPEHVPVDRLSCRIFHLGYVLLLDRMDASDDEFGTVAARVLHELHAAGIQTSLDVVSEDSDRFKTVVPPALKHTDFLIANEIEVGRTAGRAVRRDDDSLDAAALVEAVDEISALGPMQLVAVHMPEGFYVRGREGSRFSRGSLDLPEGFIRASVGAGDAFCAGMLYGLHEGWDPGDAGWLGTCCAAACLSSSTASDGLRPISEVLELGERFRERPAPVDV